MDVSQGHWLSSAIFEHACKHEFSVVLKSSLEDPDIVSKILQHSVDINGPEEKPKIKPIFMLISLLKKLHSVQNFADLPCNISGPSVLSTVIDLLESTFKQFNFISLKIFFTLISELKLLDLLQLIVNNCEGSLVVQKLNCHFPRWTSNFKATLEKHFSIENSKVLSKLEESHANCRRLILKLAVDKTYRLKYLSEKYFSDIQRLSEECKECILETIQALEARAGSSALERMLNKNELEQCHVDDPGVQLLLDYTEHDITEESLLKYLEDLQPLFGSQCTTSLTACLLPFDTMSNDEDSEPSESEYETSEEEDPAKVDETLPPSSIEDQEG